MSRVIPIDRYRTIGILANPDAGRTTTTERILAAARGDALPVPENARDITLTSAATSCVWNGCRLNMIELPSADRLVDDAQFAVLDAVVIVIDAERGVTAAIASAVSRCAARGLACLVFVNKLDRVEADLGAIIAKIPGRPVLLQLPIGAGAGLKGLLDLVGGHATYWRDARFDARAEEGPMPAEMAASAESARAEIVAAVAPGRALADSRELAHLIRDAVRAGTVVPVVCGAAFLNRGIRRLLDAVVDYLPAPSELALNATSADGQLVARLPSDDEPFSGLAFQTVEDPAVGKLTFVRIYSGVVATGAQALNSISMSPENIGSMVRIHANHTESVEEARTGDIVAVSGLLHTTTGDTLCDPAAPVILERMTARPAA